MSIDLSYTIRVNHETNAYLSSFYYVFRDFRSLAISFIAILASQIFVPFLFYLYFVWKIRMMKFELNDGNFWGNLYDTKVSRFKANFLILFLFVLSCNLSTLYLLFSHNSLSLSTNFYFILEIVIVPQLFAFSNFLYVRVLSDRIIRINLLLDLFIIIVFILVNLKLLILNLGSSPFIPVFLLFFNVLILYLIFSQKGFFKNETSTITKLQKSKDFIESVFKNFIIIFILFFLTGFLLGFLYSFLHLSSNNPIVIIWESIFSIFLIIGICLCFIYGIIYLVYRYEEFTINYY